MAKRGRKAKTKEFDDHFNVPAIPVKASGDNFSEPIKPVIEVRKSKFVPGYRPFKCYLGHTTWSSIREDSTQCIACNSFARLREPQPTDMCMCSHQNQVHSPHCKKCGIMTDGERQENEPRCPRFVLMT